MAALNYLELSAAFGAVLVIVHAAYRNRWLHLYPLPPGPKKLPIIGNLFNIPSTYSWKVYAEWSKTYKSDILHLNAAGQSIIVLNSYDDAKELLEGRSGINSSRPISVMLSELCGFGFQFGLMPYGNPWRIRRRLFKKHFSPSNAQIYQFQQTKYIHRFLYQLLERPMELMELMQHMVASTTLSMTYGVDILPDGDPNIQIAQDAVHSIRESLTIGSSTVDMIPWLKYLPSWFPGTRFQQTAAKSRVRVEKLREGIFAQALQQWLNRGSSNSCFISLCLDSCYNDDQEQMTLVKDVASITYTAATDTTVSAMKTFILAMTCFPEVQKRAQQELDRVLEGLRLPDHADLPLLPYLRALIKEVLRWQSVAPAGVPHLSTAPDVYKGYYIPEGSIIIYNAWAMLQNEVDFPDPQEFRPERFLTSDGHLRTDIRDPVDIAFGFGRRICPGSHIALSLISLAAASLLTVFTIEKTLDADGHPIEPTCEYDSGAVSQPLPFECTIKPRSRAAATLVKEVIAAADHTD